MPLNQTPFRKGFETQTEEVNVTDKVPLLGDLPFLGKLFRNDLRNIENVKYSFL